MSRRRRRAKTARSTTTSDTIWGDVCQRIADQQVIPIIGKNLPMKQIFQALPTAEDDSTNQLLDYRPYKPTVWERLAANWAEDINYPLPDRYRLEAVARYHAFHHTTKRLDIVSSKQDYLNFLIQSLYEVAEQDDTVADLVPELETIVPPPPLTELCKSLEYPPYGQADSSYSSLKLLAQLTLPVYITTSQHRFLADLLEEQKLEPQVRVCPWYRENPEPLEIERDNPQKPLVYHLFGLAEEPESLVLSEDDYMQFLIKLAQPLDDKNQILPPDIVGRMAESSLMMIGYELYDWEFRAMFQVVEKATQHRRRGNLLFQLEPSAIARIEIDGPAAQKYLDHHFKREQYRIMWGDSEAMVKELWQEWQTWQG